MSCLQLKGVSCATTIADSSQHHFASQAPPLATSFGPSVHDSSLKPPAKISTLDPEERARRALREHRFGGLQTGGSPATAGAQVQRGLGLVQPLVPLPPPCVAFN